MLRTGKRAKEILLIFALCIVTVATYTEHQTLILSGVERILIRRTPGTISLLNENSFPILAGRNSEILRSHVAAVEYGAGRIIAHSHTSSLLDENMPPEYDNIQLLINSIDWLGKNRTGKIGLYPDWKLHENILTELGYETQVLSANDFNNPTYLEPFYVLIISINANETNVREYVRNGVGGLMIAATPWNHDVNDMESFWGNIILRDTGLFYIGKYYSFGTMDCNDEVDGCFNASTEYLKDTHSAHVWNELKQLNSNQTHLPRNRTQQVMQILRDRLRYAPSDDVFNRDINEELKKLPTFVPTATNPVTAEKAKQFLVVHRFLCEFLINEVGLTSNIPPHPSAMSFPGDVVTSNGERLSHLIEIDAMLPSWTENLSVNEIIAYKSH
ncbi:TRPM8 channel-associated factor 2-like isoform X1 [Bradysia coprophila]|uniref:TRPM8 channel-associated factor 2-like isoform X1 n=1 Tax=Bradysia coprophila TaxID=38358 RepID=UPI00187DA6B6|nr:TRPM8 channel-associated factor 2-like isoform X1 [Bradysia coprophila]